MAPASESWLAPPAAPSLAYGCREPRCFPPARNLRRPATILRIPRLSSRPSRFPGSPPRNLPALSLSSGSPCAPRCTACSTNRVILNCLPRSNSSESSIVRTPNNLCNAIRALPPCSCPFPSPHKSFRMPRTHTHTAHGIDRLGSHTRIIRVIAVEYLEILGSMPWRRSPSARNAVFLVV